MLNNDTVHEIYDLLDDNDASNGEVLTLIGLLLINTVMDSDTPGATLDEALLRLRRLVVDVIAEGGLQAAAARHVELRH